MGGLLSKGDEPLTSTQIRLRIKRKLEGTDLPGRGDIQKDRLALHEDIIAWRGDQQKLMPGLNTETDSSDGNTHTVPSAEREPLLMPSALVCSKEPYVQEAWFKKLSNIELHLRRGQANDALQALVTALQYEDALQSKKRKHVKGQKAMTRAQGLLDTAYEWTVNEAVLYEHARQAVWVLGDDMDIKRYRALKASDTNIKGIYGRKQLGDGWKTDSWITEYGKRHIEDSANVKEWEEDGKFTD